MPEFIFTGVLAIQGYCMVLSALLDVRIACVFHTQGKLLLQP